MLDILIIFFIVLLIFVITKKKILGNYKRCSKIKGITQRDF